MCCFATEFNVSLIDHLFADTSSVRVLPLSIFFLVPCLRCRWAWPGYGRVGGSSRTWCWVRAKENTRRPRVAGVLSLEEGLRLVASQTASPEEFVQLASTVDFQVAQRTLVCSLSGEALSSEELLDAAYWSRQAAEPAKLSRAVDTLAELGCLVLLEMGSQSPLSGLVSTGWPGEVAPTLIASLSEDGAATHSLVWARWHSSTCPWRHA